MSKAGSTALKLATLKRHTAIITLLKTAGATGNPQVPTEAKKTTAIADLFKAITANDASKVNEALEAGADVEARDNAARWTPLMIATMNGRTEIAKLLIDKGADVNAKTNTNWTPLMGAADKGYTDIVKALIAGGADVNARDENSETALLKATRYGHTAIVKLLIDKGADTKAKTKTGDTALIWARRTNRTAIIALLKAAGATE